MTVLTAKISELTAAASTAATDIYEIETAGGASKKATAAQLLTYVNANAQVAESQVTSLVTDLAAKAPLASPTFTGTPAAPTATGGTNTTQIATTAFVTTAVGGVASGATVNTGADASKGTGTSGNLYLPNDGFYAYRSTGSAQAPWGPIFPLTAPDDSAFAWINQGGASVVTTNGGITLVDPAVNTNASYKLRKKAAPATPYTIEAMFLPTIQLTNYMSFGLGWRQSSGGAAGSIVALRWMCSGDWQWSVVKASSATADVANYASLTQGYLPNYIWMRISDDGTNRKCGYSFDGVNFMQVHSVGRTDYITPDEVFWFGDSRNATYNAYITLLSWKES